MQYPGRGDGRDGALNSVANTTDNSPCSAITLATAGVSATIDTGLTINAGDCFYIQQVQGTNHGKGEWLYVSSYNSGTGAIVFTSGASVDYSSVGANKAMITLARQYTSMATNGFTRSAQAWDGTKHGLYVALCLGQIDGIYSAVGKGFIGGTGINGGTNLNAQSGEGYNGPDSSHTSGGLPNTSGGGGAKKFDTGNRYGGGGGSNLVAGSDGDGTNFGANAHGLKGLTSSAADASQMDYGGAGGGGAGDSGAGDGGNGGGIVYLIARLFGTVSLLVSGNAGTGAANVGGGGGGAAGCARLLGESLDCTTATATLSGGAGGSTGGSTGGGGGTGLGEIEMCTITNPASSTFTTLVTGGLTWCSILGSIL